MTDPLGGALGTALEHAAADAAAGLARPGHHGPIDPNCLNCGAELHGDFCHACGQSGESLRRPFWSLFAEGIETLFSIDGRIARTLPGLMLHPGKVTRAYLDGQRQRFIPPFRLYILASLIFFVLLPLLSGQSLGFGTEGDASFEDARARIEESYQDGDLPEEAYRQALQSIDEAEAAAAMGDNDAAATLEEFRDAFDQPDRLGKATMEWIPRLMFVLLPLYAGLLALAYIWRRQFLFFDHLVVSLHFHTAMFVAMSIGALVSIVVGSGWVILGLIGWSNWYLYRMQRVVYGRSAVSSVLRTLTLDAVYFGFIMLGLLFAVILGAMSL